MDIRRRTQIGSIKRTSSGGGSTTGGSYTINLNSQWEKTTAVNNPDSTLYDGVYRSTSNYNVNSGVATMYITITDCSSFKMYIRSYAESNYDYVMVSQLDQTINGSTSYNNATLVKAHTRGNQQSGTALSSYTLVEFTGITSGEHTITVVYRKDSSVNSGDDRGYVLIDKTQAGSGDIGSGGSSAGPINTNNYLTIEALEDGLTASLSDNTCEYCVDGDGNWKTLSAGATTESISSGHTLSFRCNLTPVSYKGIGTFTISKKCNLKGNCMSILYGDNAANNYSLNGWSFYNLFNGCSTIITVSSNFLPALSLGQNCYNNMFLGCTSLINTPSLPATSIYYKSYGYMFADCTSLINPPVIKHVTRFIGVSGLGQQMIGMFRGCTSLTIAPEFPKIVDQACYAEMFSGCTSLTTAPAVLPATTLPENCYRDMFYRCTSLITVPELPATKLSQYCYESMFYGCTSLTTAPSILPATTLAKYCYNSMFSGCTSLTTAPEMLATTLASFCCENMFNDCTSLTTAPSILPATTLEEECYFGMFQGCTKLTKAPILPAEILVKRCYGWMFWGCTKLNYIKMLATDISADGCLYYWVRDVAANGTFVKNPDKTTFPTGDSGIPRGWTVVDDGEESGLTFPIQINLNDATQIDENYYGFEPSELSQSLLDWTQELGLNFDANQSEGYNAGSYIDLTNKNENYKIIIGDYELTSVTTDSTMSEIAFSNEENTCELCIAKDNSFVEFYIF